MVVKIKGSVLIELLKDICEEIEDATPSLVAELRTKMERHMKAAKQVQAQAQFGHVPPIFDTTDLDVAQLQRHHVERARKLRRFASLLDENEIYECSLDELCRLDVIDLQAPLGVYSVPT